MFLGVLYGLIAGALWGLIYVAPLFLPEYHPVVIALARFVVFGFISIPCLFYFRKQLKDFTKANFKRAFLLAFFGNVAFYCSLTISIRLSGAPLAGMLMSVIPVLVAIISNFRYRSEGKALAWRVIIPPLIAIFAGLTIANITEFEHITSGSSNPLLYWIGVGLCLFSVGAWTWFSIENGEYLLHHPHQSPTIWTAIQGVTIFPASLLLFIGGSWGMGWIDTTVSIFGPHPLKFLLVNLSVGFLCSWVAMIFWNAMSQRLPSGLGGQLIVFESIFSVIYALLWRGETPSLSMIIGFTILLSGVFGSLYIFKRAQMTVDKKDKGSTEQAAS